MHPHRISRFNKRWWYQSEECAKYPNWGNYILFRNKSRLYSIEYYEWWDYPYDTWMIINKKTIFIGRYKTLKQAKQACKNHFLGRNT